MRKTKNQSCHKNLGATILIKMEKSQKARKRLFGKRFKDHACFAGLQTFQERACKVLYRLDQKISHSRSIISLICVFTAPMST